ncbi:hypothetical protein [uncultured Dubosiella sp.]|uniref:hypothetical protein n=1 Tax=uncultured Dubosiella sp. TaxID=1937011 RepID=UPI00272F325A|nr:hypothetical protein [uncultured Dubosiella sp.]
MAHFFKHIGEDIKKYMSEMDEEMTPEDAKKKDDAALTQAVDSLAGSLQLNDDQKTLLMNTMQKVVDQSFQDGFSCGYMNGSMVGSEEGFD